MAILTTQKAGIFSMRWESSQSSRALSEFPTMRLLYHSFEHCGLALVLLPRTPLWIRRITFHASYSLDHHPAWCKKTLAFPHLWNSCLTSMFCRISSLGGYPLLLNSCPHMVSQSSYFWHLGKCALSIDFFVSFQYCIITWTHFSLFLFLKNPAFMLLQLSPILFVSQCYITRC